MDANGWAAVSGIAESLSALFVLFGFWFVVRQLRSSSVEHLYCRMHDIHRMFIEHPELRTYFYENTALPSNDPELVVRIHAAAELLADFFQQVFLELDLLPKNAALGWRLYMTDVLDRSQVLQSYVNRHRSWYPSNFVGQLLFPHS
ncbi:MAG: hypothetical protein A2579_03975 [Lysobacterales bacterium RIFOXYD1_FULL_69_11]|nr:MAG: hypothetical protein A2190_11990 [Xanthomonadales bacterium RIFOXYA1_FULL_69_10]OHE86014.1 MAG: hypothetical protein A2579_03975 [Xanthomonadales bacterium RIFOXYD1_FULL_69_11]